jgi:peptide/nickel transport system ATP-binding protein
MNLLEVDRLQVTYGSGHSLLTAVDGVSLSVAAGASLGVVGESGSGKSTLARAIVQIVPSSSGRVLLEGRDVTNAKGGAARHVRERVQMVFQDPFSSLNPRMTVGAILEEAVRLHEIAPTSARERRNRVEELLDLVTLDGSAMDRYPNQFSGGQLQRVSIARALAAEPQLLILDEVTSALDVSVQAAILNLLRELRRTLGLTYLCISHDLSVVDYLCESVVVLYLGQVVEASPCAPLFSAPRHPYSRTLLDSVPRTHGELVRTLTDGEVPDPRRPPSGCRFHPRCPIGPKSDNDRTICGLVDPHASAVEQDGTYVACHFPLG